MNQSSPVSKQIPILYPQESEKLKVRRRERITRMPRKPFHFEHGAQEVTLKTPFVPFLSKISAHNHYMAAALTVITKGLPEEKTRDTMLLAPPPPQN